MPDRHNCDFMKRLLLILLAAGLAVRGSAQLLSWTPDFPHDNDNISIIMDASKGNQGLFNFSADSAVYIHTGVITNLSTGPSNWRYVKFGQNFNLPNPQLQATSLGNNKWKIDISGIRSYYGVPAGETILRIAILFRNGNGAKVQRNADGSDMYIPVYDNNLSVRFTTPPYQPYYNLVPEPISAAVGDMLPLTGVSSQSANLKLYLNGTVIQSATAATSVSASPVLNTIGKNEAVVEADNGTVIKRDTLRFVVNTIAALPAGVRDGINYEAGNTSAVLVLYAPGKSYVNVIGEFPGNNWTAQNTNQMNKTPDGNYYWIRLTGLTPGVEYAFQYLVDGSLKVGEPYTEKILDPNNDSYISAQTYPGLRSYPAGQTGIVSILQTNAPAYSWSSSTFTRPDKRNLVVYELLLRDYLDAHDWKTLRDTLGYLKNMGVNTIEVMPFMEFDGNLSWGYNPCYYFAPDKYYGTKNALKEFVDSCHKKGMAVVLDMVLNHTSDLSPLAMLYWNAATGHPAANNPWLNVNATHPFSVYNDFNHESAATQYFTKRVVEFWLQEYKLDGFRFDLSKGFTQFNSGGDVNLWSQYDASRVAIWKKYYDTIQVKSPGAYVILEHFAANSEEIELSDYGMLLWGNHNKNFAQASMGYSTPDPDGNTWNFEGGIYSVRGWNKPHLVTYMESHDEERIMYNTLLNGNASGSYNTRDLTTALHRQEMGASFLMMMPGPKMVWEFGEQGYDFSINRCGDGSINGNCRTDAKPIRWDYLQQTARKRLYDIYSSLGKLRAHGWYKDDFIANGTTISRNMASGFKWMTIRTATDSSDLVVVGNFDVVAQTTAIAFPVPGTWYDYLQGGTITAVAGSQNITLQPGEFHIYLNRNLSNAVVTPVGGVTNPSQQFTAAIYPNPGNPASVLAVALPETGRLDVALYDLSGRSLGILYSGNLALGEHIIPLNDKINNLLPGTYLMRLQTKSGQLALKLLIP